MSDDMRIKQITDREDSGKIGGAALAASFGTIQQAGGTKIAEPPKDVAEVSKADKLDEGKAGANISALRGNLDGNKHGFEKEGVNPAFTINSINGVEKGLPPGIHPGGVHKSPPDER